MKQIQAAPWVPNKRIKVAEAISSVDESEPRWKWVKALVLFVPWSGMWTAIHARMLQTPWIGRISIIDLWP